MGASIAIEVRLYRFASAASRRSRPNAKPSCVNEKTIASPASAPNADILGRFDEDVPRPVPPLAEQDGATLTRLVHVMRRLLAPDGCPWDREHTLETLRRYGREQ